LFWTGEREFEGTGTTYDLDAALGAPEGKEDLAYDASNRTLDMSYSKDSGAWPGPTPPTSEDCRRRVKTHREEYVTVRSAAMVCLITDQNRVASLRVKQFANRDDDEVVVAEVTIWNP
jgi:hypothetical protein